MSKRLRPTIRSKLILRANHFWSVMRKQLFPSITDLWRACSTKIDPFLSQIWRAVRPRISPYMGRIRLTIGTKLISLIGGLLLVSIVSLVWLSTRMFVEDNTSLIQQINLDTATSNANQMREFFDSLQERTRVLGTVMLQQFASPDQRARVLRQFFAKDKDTLAVIVFQKQGADKARRREAALSPELEAIGDPRAIELENHFSKSESKSLTTPFLGEVRIETLALTDGTPAVLMATPFIQGPVGFSHIIITVMRLRRLLAAFGENSLLTSYLVDGLGHVVVHPDTAGVKPGESLGHLEIVRQLTAGKSNNGQTRYYHPGSKRYILGAFRTVGFAGLGVIAEVPEEKAFEAAKRVQFRAMLIGLAILFMSFMIGYLYSGTITWPIKELVHVALRISKGDFKINLKPTSQDEIAQLALAFNDMAKGLEERDKVKATFNKFHSKEIAEKLLSGEVKLGGERKEATIFFSDIRGFTGMSESMQPEQVVELLNEYMTRMVAIITKRQGIVDKYIGDAIMGLWGVPLGKADDTYNAVRACLDMRMELAALNEARIKRGQHALKIGMGLNCGMVIAGNIGSEEKMEYTVIGDTVNTASRMESMTKEYGTDFLIPLAVQEKVKDRFIFEEADPVKVKGKTDPIRVFTVQGYIDDGGKKVLLKTPYSSYKSEKSDKGAH